MARGGSGARHSRCRKRRLKLLKHRVTAGIKNYSEGNANRWRSKSRNGQGDAEWWMT